MNETLVVYGYSSNVTSGPTMADIAQLLVAHAQTILPDMVTSGDVTDVTSCYVTDVTFGHVTSGSTTAQHHRKYDLSCAHILLTGLANYDHWLGNF